MSAISPLIRDLSFSHTKLSSRAGGEGSVFVPSGIAVTRAENRSLAALVMTMSQCVQHWRTRTANPFYPTLPSRLTLSNFCASTANSIGSSRKTRLQKPFTIIETASSAFSPRCRR